MAEQVTVRREVSNLYAIIGGLVSAGSLISLVQKFFNIGLAPVLAEFVAYYRRIAHFFVDWLFFWVPFEVPGWYKDAYVISFVFLVTFVRAIVAVLVFRYPSGGSKAIPFFAAGLVGALFWSVPLVGLFMPLAAPRLLGGFEQQDEAKAMLRLYTKMLFAMAIATVAFFALNSQM